MPYTIQVPFKHIYENTKCFLHISENDLESSGRFSQIFLEVNKISRLPFSLLNNLIENVRINKTIIDNIIY